jgi:hypothetical protein
MVIQSLLAVYKKTWMVFSISLSESAMLRDGPMLT